MAEGFVHLTQVRAVDLLAQLAVEAEARGWEVLHVSSPGGSSRVHLRNGSLYLNFAAAHNVTGYGPLLPFADGDGQGNGWPGHDRLLMNASESFDPDLPWYFQPGSSRAGISSTDPSGVVGIKADYCGLSGAGSALNAYLFFYDNPAALAVVWEPVKGCFQWLLAGQLDKAYDFQGGQYFGASVGVRAESWNMARPLHKILVRVDHPEVVYPRPEYPDRWRTGWVAPAAREISDQFPYQMSDRQSGQAVPGAWRVTDGSLVVNSDVVNRAWEPTSGRMWTQPVRAYANRTDNTKSFIGFVPHVQHISTEVVTGATPLQFGGVEYLGFPVSARFSPFATDAATTSSPWTPSIFMSNWYGLGFMLRKPEPLVEGSGNG